MRRAEQSRAYIYPQWGIINKPCVQGSIRYVMWTIRSRMHTYLFKKKKNSPSWNKIWSKVQHVRTMLLPQAASSERCCTLCELPWPMHMPRWHWTSHIVHMAHLTWTTAHRTRGHGTAGKAVTIRSACPTGVAATRTTNCWTRRWVVTVNVSRNGVGHGNGNHLTKCWPTGQLVGLASPRLAARSVAFFIGHIVKHVVHTCKHILQSNIGPDRHQGRATSSLVPSSPSHPSWGWPK